MSIYLDNKYSKVYFKIINRAISERRFKSSGELYENHHIIPKSCGGPNEQTNLVLLTPKEHYVCHRLLPKMMVLKSHTTKMIRAIWCLANGYGSQHRYKPNARVYQNIKTELSKRNSEDNPAKRKEVKDKLRSAALGRIHSPETKAKMSKSLSGKHFTDEHREKLGSVNRGKTRSEETKLKLSAIVKGRVLSEETKQKIKESQKLRWSKLKTTQAEGS